MTKETERELNKLVDRIRSYPKGFEFTINYSDIPTRAKYNAMMWVVNKAQQLGLIKTISVGLSFESIRGESWGPHSEETFRRI